MNEQIAIRLIKKDGTRVPVDKVEKGGLILRHETDSFPREFVIGLRPRGGVTEFKMDRVRRMEGWGPNEFHLRISAGQGRLVLTGVNERALPHGSYWVQLRIGDLRIKRSSTAVKVLEDGRKIVDIKVTEDSRNVKVTQPIDTFDSHIRAVLEASDSKLDGALLKDWVYSDRPRARRRACLLNILAKLRVLPSKSEPLITHINSIFFGATDRIYANVHSDFYKCLSSLSKLQSKPFYYEGSPGSKTHAKLLIEITPPDPNGERFTLHSFRHERDPSLQAVIAVPNDGNDGEMCYTDLDIDLGNPLRDVRGLVTHLGELVNPGKTDHLKLWKTLKGKNEGQYLNYKVVKFKG